MKIVEKFPSHQYANVNHCRCVYRCCIGLLLENVFILSDAIERGGSEKDENSIVICFNEKERGKEKGK
jgi:hypothetical protein